MEKSKVFIKKICLYLQFDIHSKTCNAKIRMNRSFPLTLQYHYFVIAAGC